MEETVQTYFLKNDPTINYLRDINLKYENANKVKAKRWKRICHANAGDKRPGEVTFT